MLTRMRLSSLAWITLMLAGCNRSLDASFEGTITMRTTYPTRPAQDLTLHIKNGKTRFDTTGDDGKPVRGLYDAASNRVTLLFDEDKAFTVLNMAGATAPSPNTTPEASVATKTGKTQVIAGTKCEEWTAQEPSGKRSEVCVVEGVNFFDLQRLRSGAAADLGGPKGDKKMFALRSVEIDANGKELSHMEVTKIERGSVDDATLDIPVSYNDITPAPPSVHAPPR